MEKWNDYFYKMAIIVATQSPCMSRKIGAVLVRDRAIISTGYNGPARGVPHCNDGRKWNTALSDEISQHLLFNIKQDKELTKCPRRSLGYSSNEGLHLCPAAHAEANCLIQAARNGVSTLDTSMYVTCEIPCKNCLSLIINAGVKEVICASLNFYDKLSPFIARGRLIIKDYDGEEIN